MNTEELKKLKQAGEIAKNVKNFAKEIVLPGTPLIEIAEKLEQEIIKQGGKPAFPVNLSINEVAAHYTPSHDDKTKAHGLIKIDLGVHIDGYVADTAFSLDLENDEENKRLIVAAESALKSALLTANLGTSLSEIGSVIEKSIKDLHLQPIQNLSGHSIDHFDLHSGITIPNYNNHKTHPLSVGTYAIEPFATNGQGSVKEGKPSRIYQLENETKNVRDMFSRKVLTFIKEEYGKLPFCSRWLVNKFGTRAIIALRDIENQNILHHFPQLLEIGNGKVAQAEHTIILTENEKIISTQ